MTTQTLLARSNSRGSNFELAYASPIVNQIVLRQMGAGMESFHRHNSKKNRPRALNDEAGKLGRDGRKRRSRGSSDDEGKIAEDGFSNEDLRAGGPYLCSVPLSSYPLPRTNQLQGLLQHKVSGGETISNRVRQILRNRNISLISVGRWDNPVTLSLRQSNFNPEREPVPTIVILARRHVVDDLWLKTARQIYFLLQQENFGHVSVEILDPQALHPPRTLPVLKSDPMFNKWDSVLGRILRDVDLTDIQLIGCYRRGNNSGNENPVTVLVITNVNNQKDWRATRDRITSILELFNLPTVAVEIVRDRKTLFKNFRKEEGFKKGLLTGTAMAGGPIAHSRNDGGSGTLGGFIELQHPSSLKWLCYALTCFHVIDPRDRDIGGQELEAVQKWRRSGLSMVPTKDAWAQVILAQQCLKTSHPSQLAKKEQIDEFRGDIKYQKSDHLYQHGLNLRDNDLFDELSELKKKLWNEIHSEVMDREKQIKDTQRFFQNSDNILGPVRVASGYRLKNLHTLGDKKHPTNLDWALIKVDVEKRNPSNKLEDGVVLQRIASSEKLSRLASDDSTNQLEFQGYRPGLNRVRYNELQVAEIEDGHPNLEYTIGAFDEKGHAALMGDSGSLLCTRHPYREVVGMIIAGYHFNPIARFTRIDDLIGDIKEQSGAKDIRMLGN